MADAAASARQWDLVPRMTPFLDRHLVLPNLEFLEELGVCSLRVIILYLFMCLIVAPDATDERN